MNLNKWKNGILPALLIHGSIGTIYCWSLLTPKLLEIIGECSTWAFSVAVFMMGMSAALLGPIVEKHLKKSAILSSILFGVGMILSGVACSVGSVHLFIAGYGILMGIGIGLGYLSPIKTLMQWFKNNKGLATGLAISGFGFSKVFAAPGFNYFIHNFGLETMFYFHGVFYTIVMLIAGFLLKIPEDEEINKERISLRVWFDRLFTAIKSPGLWIYWALFYINITAGLAIVSYEYFFFTSAGYAAMGLGFCLSMAAIFNFAGRLGAGWLSDSMKDRSKILGLILLLSVLSCMLGFIFPGFVPFSVLFCNAGYGAMFAVMPSILSDRFGMTKLNETYGIILSAMAFAGLTGNQLATWAVNIPGSTHQTLILFAGIIYTIGLYISVKFWK